MTLVALGAILLACDAGIRDCQVPADCFGGELCVRGQCILVSHDLDAQGLDTQHSDTPGADTANDDTQGADTPGEDTAAPQTCDANDDCEDSLICRDQACVECTSTSGSCRGYSCNPLTNTCTTTGLGSQADCRTCTATSECKDPTSRCVPMVFKGTQLPDYYCLPLQLGNPCYPPYAQPVQRVALSETEPQVYCAPNELLTTCEGLFDTNTQCSENAQCGKEGYEDGLCKFQTCRTPCIDNDDCFPGDSCIANLYCQSI